MARWPALALLIVASLAGCEGREGRLPTATRACTPPREYWQKPHYIGGLIAPYTRISLDHQNHVFMSGKLATPQQLTAELEKLYAVTNPDMPILLDTEMGADCAALEALRNKIDRAMKCRASGRCAEGSFVVWMETPPAPGTPPS